MPYNLRLQTLLTTCSLIALSCHTPQAYAKKKPVATKKHQVILFIWDGLRPDSITRKDTPNLYRLKQQGSYFTDNHSSYPTLTMVNAASFATGDLAGKTGFYGNVIWSPYSTGKNASGKHINFKAPIFTEDYQILADLNKQTNGGPALNTNHLFTLLHQHNIRTAAVGKSGPAALQTALTKRNSNSLILDEKHVYPLAFAKWMQKHGLRLPKSSPKAFQQGLLTLKKNNANPTRFDKIAVMTTLSSKTLGGPSTFNYPNTVTTDPSATSTSPYSRANRYLLSSYLHAVIPYQKPQMSVLWLRNPDSTEHNYGVGSHSYYSALHSQDKLLGQLIRNLKKHNHWNSTDLIIASDHSHSNVSANLHDFPLRAIQHHQVSNIDRQGYSVSGDFRPAELMHRAGFDAYDGDGCEYDPTMSGIRANGSLHYPVKHDTNGKACHSRVLLKDPYGHRSRTLKQTLYTSGDYRLPKKLPEDAVIIASNGGSTYFYIPSHNPVLIRRIARFIQSRPEFGPLFVHQRYHKIPGTLSLKLIKLYNRRGKNPDIIASSHYDNQAIIQGFKGIEYNSSGINRGMHGSFSHTDIHNTLIAYGPDFKSGFTDPLPSANTDIPTTIAHLFSIPMPKTDGRVLSEALKVGQPLSHYRVKIEHIRPEQSASNLPIQSAPTSNNAHSKHNFTEQLNIKRLCFGQQSTLYFDSAKEIRY